MRNALIIGGLIVAAIVVALYLAISKDTSEQASAQPSDPVTEPAGSAAARPSGGTTTRPGLAVESPALPEPEPGQNPRDYVVGDIRVRDHRSGDNKPLDIPPNPHPAEGRVIPSTLTHEVAQKVKGVMIECTKSLPAGARGSKPRLEGQIIVSIKNNKVTVDKSVMQLRDVSDDAVEPTKQCIEQKSIGLENSAGGEPDLDSYSINVSFAIP